MSNLKRLRSRVRSIRATQKITKAMQMVAASKLRKIRDKISDSEHYLQALREIMAEVAAGSGEEMAPSERIFFDVTPENHSPELFVVLTSERGLCGSFNSSIVRQVKNDIAEALGQGKDFRLIVVGKKGYDLLKGKYSDYISNYFIQAKQNEKILPVEVKNRIMQMITAGKARACRLYFSRFKNALTQIPAREKIFPIVKESSLEKKKSTSYSYEFEGSGLVMGMINLYLTGQINYGLLQNRAGEEGARMTAMENATKNAGDMIDRLTLQLNRTRQAVITKELIEIISGAEAV